MGFFPMYVDMTDKPCAVLGGGKEAYEAAGMLLDFEAEVTVIAPQISGELWELASMRMQMRSESKKKGKELKGNLYIEERDYQEADVMGSQLVILATGDVAFEETMAAFCKKNNIAVCSRFAPKAGSFSLPTYLKEQNVVGAFYAGAKSKVLTNYLRERERDILTSKLGDIDACISKWQPAIEDFFQTEEDRTKVYQDILDFGLCNEKAPDDEEVQSLIACVGSGGRFM